MKKMIKRALSLSMAAVMAAAVVTGCGSDSNTGAAKDGKKSVTLTFGSHQSGLPTSGIVQDLAKEFEAETGIKIDFQISPDAQWRDLIKVKLDSGAAPDISARTLPRSISESFSFIPVPPRVCAP